MKNVVSPLTKHLINNFAKACDAVSLYINASNLAEFIL